MNPHEESRFRAFVDARSRSLLHTARLLTPDAHAAEDLLQEALARLVPRWGRVDNPEAYTRVTMHRLQISRWRRRAVVTEDSVAEFAEFPGAGSRDHSGAVHDRMVLAAALARLTPRQRSVLICRHIEDLDERETARRLGIRVGSVRSINGRALARLLALGPELADFRPVRTPPHRPARVDHGGLAVNALESALHLLADDGSTAPARPDLADRVLARARTRGRGRGALAAAGAAATVAVITIGLTVAGGAPEAHRPPPGPAASGSSATSTSPVLARARNNVLLIGSDAAPDRIGVRPDTMILASIDTRTGTTTMFGFPRAMQRVPFPAGSGAARAFPHGYVCADQECLLNSIWTWAEGSGARYYPGDPHPGLTATTQAIEQVSGLRVTDTVVVDMAGLSRLIDAVGGVTVNVNQRLPIGGNADPTSSDYHRATGGWIEAGPKQHLDGYHALWFARSRWSNDDYERMARQQCLVRALVQQVGPAQLITAYPKIARALRGSLQTSIAVRDLPAWAELVSLMRDAPVRSVALDPRSGVDPARPDFAAIRRIVQKVVSPGQDAGSAARAGGASSGTDMPSSPRC